MKQYFWLILFFLCFQFVFGQTKEDGKQIKVFPDDYSELDDVPVTQQIEDPFITKTLERARLKYLRGLSFIEKKDTLRAEENFEQAIDILNSISYYPGINKYRDYTDLILSILEDYEKYIRNIDKLDESSSLMILRETLTKELEKTARSKPQIGILKSSTKDTTKPLEAKAGYAFQIPMDDNECVRKSIEFLTQKPIGRKFVRNSLARSTIWGNIVRKIIEEEKMPKEIFYLAMVESGFNPFAVSRAKAVGMWQFMMSTGQLYGLNANNSPWIDERRDPIKSTRAAMRHLRDLYNELGDWHLAIAAYNCGINAVQRAIAKLNNSDSVNFWTIMPFLPRETRNYVPLFIATVMVVNNLEAFGFGKSDIEYLPEIQFDKYTLKEPVSLTALAKCANISVEELKQLNPELLYSFTPPESQEYELRIPLGSKQAFVANYLNLTQEEKQPFFSYRLERKETIEDIARKYNVDTHEILLVNNIASASKKLPKGTILKIPIIKTEVANNDNGSDKSEISANIAEVENPTTVSEKKFFENSNQENRKISVVRYIVKENDNIYTISQKFNTHPDSIIKWNELSSREVSPGQALRIYTRELSNNSLSSQPKITSIGEKKSDEIQIASKKERQSPSKASNTSLAAKTRKIHKVHKGETLQTIAEDYDVTIEQILEWNPNLKKRKHTIRVGEKIVIGNGIDKAKSNLSKTKVASKKENKKTKVRYHIVRKGETLSDISKKYGLSLNEIRTLNPKLKSTKIKTGERIRVD
jgi:membrane-bound lytic murein transglycosylase D